jgi:hypothetical protein
MNKEFYHLNYSNELEEYLKSTNLNHYQYPGSYWRREMVIIELNKNKYSFRAYENAPFSNIISLKQLKELI